MEIQDFGEKIGGARKDLWKERGLSISDLSEMNDSEKSKLIKKDNVWKKPNYQELVNNGLPIRVVYFMKRMRDATPTKPDLFIYNTDSKIIKERQEGYIEFVAALRDAVMSLTTEQEILNFYNDFMMKYLTASSPYSHLVTPSPLAYGCIDNKLLKASQVTRLEFLDSEIRKKQFCYTDKEKILSKYKIYLLDNEKVKLTKDEHNGRTVIEVQVGFGKIFIYPQDDFAEFNNWKENTVFIQDIEKRRIIKNNLDTIEDAEKYILENFQEDKQKTIRSHKKGFTPKQLEHITRTGENYRKGKDITGEDMMQTFDFRGGEFGNWLNENDRQQSLNYGYDALLDLSKALQISPEDISLGNRLSIAFGSRGSGNALAHYEPDREVINLTKMKGAGSLAHEWGHALDDIIGKQLDCKGFFSENYKFSDDTSNTIKDLVETMKYKTVCNEETTKSQQKDYYNQISRLKNFVNSFFPKDSLTKEQTQYKDKLIQNLIDNAKQANETFSSYLTIETGNKDIGDLSDFRKQTIGRGFPKEERNRLARLQNSVYQKQNNIGKPQKVETDFYRNSKQFDELYSKTDHGYWQSTVEMFARAFACYVSDKLENRSDYLCGHAEAGIGLGANEKKEVIVIKAFPDGEERNIINEKIDQFIGFLKEKELLHDCKTQEISNDIELEVD